jgi:hypothetical protein
LKAELLSALRAKFASGNLQERDYALEYFIDVLSKFQRKDVHAIENVFIRRLKEGIAAFHDPLLFSPWSDWSEEMSSAYKQFSPQSDPSFDDEIPF